MFAPAHRYRTGIQLRNAIVLSLLVWVLTGCASGLSDYSRAMVTYEGDFAALQDAPDRYLVPDFHAENSTGEFLCGFRPREDRFDLADLEAAYDRSAVVPVRT